MKLRQPTKIEFCLLLFVELEKKTGTERNSTKKWVIIKRPQMLHLSSAQFHKFLSPPPEMEDGDGREQRECQRPSSFR